MTIPIGWFSFDGPFESPDQIEAKAGVFVVLAAAEGGKFTMLEIDQAEDISAGLTTHERKNCWEENKDCGLQYAVMYTPDLSDESRQLIVKEIRMEYVMPCSPSETPSHGYWRPEDQ